MNGYDVTFPKVPLTGREDAIDRLIRADERNLSYGLTPDLLQAPYLTLENRLSAGVPESLRKRVAVARKLATYAYFCYEFYAVSAFWSVSCIEMAMKLKFSECHPDPITLRKKQRTIDVQHYQLDTYLTKSWRIVGMPNFNYSFKALLAWAFDSKLLPSDIPIPIQELVNSYNNRFRLEVFPEWAQKRDLLPSDGITLGDIENCWQNLRDEDRASLKRTAAELLTQELPNFRNMMAHPRDYNFLTFPNAPLRAFDLLTDVVSRLWADTVES